jgi:hypothetical protein
MAKEINKKKAHNKALQNSKNFEKNLIKGIYAYNDQNNFAYSSTSCNTSNGDFVSGLPSTLEDSQSFDNSTYNQNLSKKTPSVSESSSEYDIYKTDDELISNYSSLPKKTQKKLRLHNTHLNKYHDHEDTEVLGHLKNCIECKKKLLELLHSDKNNINNKGINNKDDVNNFLGLSNIELRNIMFVVVVGIIIIIVIDIFLS